jgi:hypothetical protein
VFPFELNRQLQHRRLGARLHLTFGRDQRVEPAGPPGPDPAIQAGPRDRDRFPERADVHPAGELADQPAAFDPGQGRIGQRPDQGITEQRDIPRPGRPGLLT